MTQAGANLVGAAAAPRDVASKAVEPQYEGLVTRTIAFAVDAAIINVVAIVVGVGVGLIMSVLPIHDSADTVLLAIGGVAFALWSIAYFVTFWSTTGQTPGDHVMRIRVCRDGAGEDAVIAPRRALLRLAALVLAALPLGAGVLLMLVDDRRRGLHDMIAGTVVLTAPRAR